MRFIRFISKVIANITKIILLLLKYLFIYLFFPLYVLFRVLSPWELQQELKKYKNKFLLVFKSILLISIVLFVLNPIWLRGYSISKNIITGYLGYNPESIKIAGTGSMYPTFPKGHGKTDEQLSKEIVSAPGMLPFPNGFVFKGKRYFSYNLKRGDIVVIDNKTIEDYSQKVYGSPSGWVKRLIALPGDIIEIRDGVVYLNKVPQKEPYTALAHSTFGERYLSECKQLIIPDNQIFVMGDNRKASGDSREIGLIPMSAVNHVLPYERQIGIYDKNWRDTGNDLNENTKIKVEKSEYLKLLNEKRREMGVQKLNYQVKLERSAGKRGEIILKYDDFSFEATRSGYTMQKSLHDVGYSNIVWGEVPIQGYYESVELIENQFEFPTSKNFLLNKDFSEIGISTTQGNINNCPTQVIVFHLAGYIPPNYKQSEIASWKTAYRTLKEIQPGWQKLKEYSDFYNKHKNEIDRINEIISIRINNVSVIISRMEANQWFNENDKRIISQDKQLSEEEDSLAKKINSF
jgi:signal peptidase I